MSILVLIIRRSLFLSRSESKRREPSYRNRATVIECVSACEHLPDPVSAALPRDKFPVLLMQRTSAGQGQGGCPEAVALGDLGKLVNVDVQGEIQPQDDHEFRGCAAEHTHMCVALEVGTKGIWGGQTFVPKEPLYMATN
jgi:hypothetical protein